MLPPDVYRTQLDHTIAALKAWMGFITTVASVEISGDLEAWRLAIHPSMRQACPLELMLRGDQHYDLLIGPETYEDKPVINLDIFIPIIEAVTEGHVITRHWRSAGTTLERSVETIVGSPRAVIWRAERLTPLATLIDPEECVSDDHYYLPYRRANAS